MRTWTLATIVAVAALSSAPALSQGWIRSDGVRQPVVQGNRHIVTDGRRTGGFDQLEVGGSPEVIVMVGRAPSVTVRGDSNILPFVITRVQGRTLFVTTRGAFQTSSPLQVMITVPSLAAVRSNGSGRLLLNGVAGPSLAVVANGSGKIRVSGRARVLDVALQGSSTIDLADLPTERARVRINGSGIVTVNAREALEAYNSGSGQIRFIGRPSLSMHNSGTGSIRRIG